MNYLVGCDAHKRFSQFAVLNRQGDLCRQERVEHVPGAIRGWLHTLPPGTPVAPETVGNYYWLADEMEAAGCKVLLTHAARAKLMMGQVNKSDKLDARGLATLLRNGTLPAVWLPPGELRDERELPRTRMALSHMRTRLKNRLHATLAKYALVLEQASDIFAHSLRSSLLRLAGKLPPETKRCFRQELELLDQLAAQIARLEERMAAWMQEAPEMQWLDSLPGFGKILSTVVAREMGTAERFPTAGHFAGYSGCLPR